MHVRINNGKHLGHKKSFPGTLMPSGLFFFPACFPPFAAFHHFTEDDQAQNACCNQIHPSKKRTPFHKLVLSLVLRKKSSLELSSPFFVNPPREGHALSGSIDRVQFRL